MLQERFALARRWIGEECHGQRPLVEYPFIFLVNAFFLWFITLFPEMLSLAMLGLNCGYTAMNGRKEWSPLNPL
ncbi:MAG: hypothetical protein HKP10_03375 [Kiritimatiellales bacterium]|nr:hypothetical protein [Kiritimatiellales bacterium]